MKRWKIFGLFAVVGCVGVLAVVVGVLGGCATLSTSTGSDGVVTVVETRVDIGAVVDGLMAVKDVLPALAGVYRDTWLAFRAAELAGDAAEAERQYVALMGMLEIIKGKRAELSGEVLGGKLVVPAWPDVMDRGGS